MRQVIVYPGEDGCWVAECPTLPGCISQGKTREVAVQNIREAVEGYIAALEEGGLSVLQAEIQEARAAYQTGDYVTIDEYVARQQVRV